MYNYIINEISGESFPCSDFYLYPLTANDYADVYKNYEFSKYPAMAFIYLTNKCTDNCVGCFARAIEDGNSYLSKDKIFELLEDLALHGTKAIKLAGREPTASPYFSDCLFKCKELGMKSLVITSGANINNHLEALSTAVTHLRISLNTISEELHEKIHRPTKEALCFNDRIKYVKEIVKKRNELGLITGATYLVRTSDDTNGYEYAKMCREIGFDYVRFTVLDENKGNWAEEWNNFYNKILRLETDNFKIITHNSIPKIDISIDNVNLIDPAIISRVVIHANGKVNSCHEGWRGDWIEKDMATFGNINQQSFNRIWNGEKRKEFLNHITKAHKNGEIQFGDCMKGEKVCNHNCKYGCFNIIQKWIIKQLEDAENSTFGQINVLENWDNFNYRT